LVKDLIEVKKPRKPMFAYDRAIGDAAKAIVRCLLEGAGYSVYPFGYESFLTRIKDLVHQDKVFEITSPTKIDQLRTMPDFIVVDEESAVVDPKGERPETYAGIDFVEIKFRNRPPTNVSINRYVLEGYKKYWPDSVLVIVLPYDDVFYAIKAEEATSNATILKSTPTIADLPSLKNYKIDKYFYRVKESKKVLENLKNLVLEMFKK